ncbi:MAG: SAM-dependent chlorinase/fluorinase [Bacteroidales bacterium]|nr:SAM-dependent chlorinase/fluorinase [Bacteroidales bacterium]
MESPIITLTTDWGYRDFFAGMVKGKLYSQIANLRVVDITHGVSQFNIPCAAFVVRHACLGFPKGTIHIIDIDSQETSTAAFVIVEYKEQYYICTDNGLPYAVFGNDFTKVVAFHCDPADNCTFAAYDRFCGIAIQLANGRRPEDLGTRKDGLIPASTYTYISSNNTLKVYVAYIDAYGNAYLGITYDEFRNIQRERPFRLITNGPTITSLSNTYGTADKTDLRAKEALTVSATGLLEISLYHASAERLMGLHVNEYVTFNFAG